jgi:diguanylate cyclase (GGDEF)-like protein
MKKTSGNPFGDDLPALRERKRVLDGVWVLSLAVVFAAISVLWLLRVAEFDLAAVAWSTFGYALAYMLAASFTDRLRHGLGLATTARLMQVSGVIFLGYLWHLVGGLDNPMFLLAFILPVICSGVIMLPWQSFVIALLSVLFVVSLALAESTELRWYTSRMGAPLERLVGFLPTLTPRHARPFADLETGPAYQFALLEIFAVLQFTVAFLSGSLATLLLRLYDRLQFSTRTLRELQGLFQAILRASPEPSLILYADTGQVVQASTSFFNRMLLTPADLVGKGLFDVITFAKPDRVREVVTQETGEVPFCVYKVGAETRIANLRSYRTRHGETTYTYVGLQELTDLYYLRAAFDAIDECVLVIGADGRLLYANHGARKLFGPMHFGMNLQDSLTVAGLLLDWWKREDQGGTLRRVEVARHPYEVSGVKAHLPGESEPVTILWLRSVEREAALFEQAARDPLTGLYNRRYFNDALKRKIAGVGRGLKLACAYLDLDNLKTLNDEFGHGGGDTALVGFAAAVKSELRATEVFARLGGDEFGILFTGTEASAAITVIERVYQRLARNPLTFQDRAVTLSFSCGLAACHADDSVEELMARADRALYQAKSAGKGKCVTEDGMSHRKAAGNQ